MSAVGLDPGAIWRRFEDAVGAIVLGAMVVFPVLDMIARVALGSSLPGAIDYTQHLSLWVGFVGAGLAARDGHHLSLVAEPIAPLLDRVGPLRGVLHTITCAVAMCLAAASSMLVASEFESPVRVGGVVPVWMMQCAMPIGFALIAVRTAGRAGTVPEILAVAVVAAVICIVYLHVPVPAPLVWPLVGAFVLAGILGLPIFVMLGGIALVMLSSGGLPAAALPAEAYRLVVSPTIPAIPLFTLAGLVLASGGAARRLVDVFDACFGWFPGGVVVAATLVCAFFSAFGGASGVTILALGGLLLPALVHAGSSERFAVGLITATGSIGLLFPPSLALILYAVVAEVPIVDLFRAAAIPGIVMVAAVCAYGVLQSRGARTPRRASGAAVARALWRARFDLMLPVVVLVALFSGFASLIEAAAVGACYALLVETLVHRDLDIRRDVPRVMVRCVVLLGGVMIIIGVAMGLTNYFVDAMIPMQLVDWLSHHVDSRWAFLLLLNLMLLVVGCVMDMFSAIFVVLPLVIPASRMYGVDPLHLGVVFLINLEIGYLTPPVGMNLFLASYRLQRPILEIYRSVAPFLAVLAVVLVLVTFVPELTLVGTGR